MTDRQARFIDAFLLGRRGIRLNATRAAKSVGYRWPGRQGPRLTTHPDLAAEIEARSTALDRGDADPPAYSCRNDTPGALATEPDPDRSMTRIAVAASGDRN